MSNGTLYTTISQHCNRATNGVYAMDMSDPKRPINRFESAGGIWGRAGVAVGTDGKVYAELGDGAFEPENGKLSDAVVQLEPKTMKLLDYYVPKNQRFVDKKDLDMGNISPVVFAWKGRDVIAASGKEGVIFLLDSKSMGGADHRTPLFRSPTYTNAEANFMMRGFWGAFGTWESNGTRWLYGSAYGPANAEAVKFPVEYGPADNGSVMAFKVVEKDGAPVLEPAWKSVDMIAPDPVLIVNGIVFALATGDDTHQVNSGGGILSSKEREANAKPAVLYGLDAETGKILFSSKDTIKSFTHFSGLAVSEGRIYVVTSDSTVYAFGLGNESGG